jgi:hypothetical protein
MAYHDLKGRLQGTRIAVSPSQQLCVLPEKIEIGDVVCILVGSTMPFILRPEGEHNHRREYQIVGVGYVHKVMYKKPITNSPKRVSPGDDDAYDGAFEEIWFV